METNNITEKLRQVIMYTDGSCLNNGNNGTGGYCALLQTPDKSKSKIVKGSRLDTTNNRMEMTAIIEGLRVIKRPSKITIYSDSNITVRAINEWIEGWQRKNFKKVANVDLWTEYLEVSSKHKVTAVWIKAHNGQPENVLVDNIAREEALRRHSKRGVLYGF